MPLARVDVGGGEGRDLRRHFLDVFRAAAGGDGDDFDAVWRGLRDGRRPCPNSVPIKAVLQNSTAVRSGDDREAMVFIVSPCGGSL